MQNEAGWDRKCQRRQTETMMFSARTEFSQIGSDKSLALIGSAEAGNTEG